MAVLSRRGPVPGLPRRPDLRVIDRRRRAAGLDAPTYFVGNAIFWMLWAATFVSADAWYWWLVAPLVGWTTVIAFRLWHVASHPPPTRDASARVREEL